MEIEPYTDNVFYLDEYPELKKKVWLRRLIQQRLGETAVSTGQVYKFKTPERSDG